MAYKYSSWIFDKTTGTYAPVSKPQSNDGILYGDIIDAPIKNVKGTSEYSPVDVSSLDQGEYSISGYYRLDRDSELQNIEDGQFRINVFDDETTGNKAVMYKSISDGKVYTTVITYKANKDIDEVVKTQDGDESAIDAVADMVDIVKSDSVIILGHENGSLLYTLYQGAQDEQHKIGEINIPVDMVATSGSLYMATSEDSLLIEGNLYIRMQIANGEPFFIPVQDLVDVYSGSGATTGIRIDVGNDGVISATVMTLDGSKIDSGTISKTALASAVQASLGLADSAVQIITEGSVNGEINVDGNGVKVHGLDTAAYQPTTAFDSAGSADDVYNQLLGNSKTDTVNSKTIEGVTKRMNEMSDYLHWERF